MNSGRRPSHFRAAVLRSAAQDRSKSAYGHLRLPRGVSVFNPKPKSLMALDILPYPVVDPHHPDRDVEFDKAIEGKLWYRRPYKLHRTVGLSNKSLVCPISIGKKCPICDYHDKEIASEKLDWNDDEAKAMRPTDRNLYYVIPKGDWTVHEARPEYEEKPYLWDMSQFLFQEKLIDEVETNESFADFPDLEIGLTLRIRFGEGKYKGNSYALTSRIDFEPRKYVYTEEVVRALASLDGVLEVKSYGEVERLFFESGDETVSDDKVTETHRTRAPADGDWSEKSDERAPADGDWSDDEVKPVRSAPLTRARPAVAPPNTATVVQHPRASVGNGGAPTMMRRQRPPAAPPPPPDPEPVVEIAIGECPFGHRFGVDTDTLPDCENCPGDTWNACMDARDASR